MIKKSIDTIPMMKATNRYVTDDEKKTTDTIPMITATNRYDTDDQYNQSMRYGLPKQPVETMPMVKTTIDPIPIIKTIYTITENHNN